jgi:hypothetical protein
MATIDMNLDKYPDLIQGFDHIRAGKYFDPEVLKQAIEDTQTKELVVKHVPGWKQFLEGYAAKLSKTKVIIRIAKFLKVFELSVLAAYVTLLGFNLFQEIAWMDVVLPWATVFVFVFFGLIYGITFFLVEKPTENRLKNFHQDNKKFSKGLFKLVCVFIEMLDVALLEGGLNAGEYGLKLYAKDYPGIFVSTNPSRFGDRYYTASPYPLHAAFVEKRSRINVLMHSYRDDRLLKALSNMSGKFQLNLVATGDISGHRIFKDATESILEKNPRSKIMVIPADKSKKLVAVFTVDGIWQLDFGRSIRPNELKYEPVMDEEKRNELEERFNQGSLRGERYKPYG